VVIGYMAATIRDVARLAGVSVATVSRVINNRGYINRETEKKVREAMQKLQYEPNQVARGLAGKRTMTIALILPDISNPFFPELARAVEDVAGRNGYTVILCNSDDLGTKEKSYIEVLRKKYIDGIIFASNTLGTEEIEQMREYNIPLVMLDRAPSTDGCSVVRAKNREGARLAVNHLLEVGCKKIAHIYGPPELHTAKNRLIGYEETVKAYPWYSPTLMVPGYFTIEGGMKATATLLKVHPDVDGIFAGNDSMAIGVLKELHRLGIDVPNKVAVCGFDGINLTKITQPELTTIAQPIYEMGKIAGDILIKKINGLMDDDCIYELDVSLIKRGST
jgi:LacI family transcriptional regulator